MKYNLTYRQQSFLDQFLDIYQETDQPLHYTLVAERLSIGKVTAYEMLRLLEEYGLVSSEYQKRSNRSGPGRSVVLFYPTQEALRLIKEIAGEDTDISNWSIVKNQILQKLQTGEVGIYKELLEDILIRIPEGRSPLIIITELITAVILLLSFIQDSPGVKNLLEHLQHIGLPKSASLHVMSGIATFLSAIEKTNRRYSSVLLSEFNRYEEMLSKLDNEYRNVVSEFTREAVTILTK